MVNFEDLKTLFKDCKTYEGQYAPTFRKLLKMMETDDILCAFQTEQYEQYKNTLSVQQMKHVRSLGDKMKATGLYDGELPWRNEKVILIDDKKSKGHKESGGEDEDEDDGESGDGDGKDEGEGEEDESSESVKEIYVDTESEQSLPIENITNIYEAEIIDLKNKNHDLQARNQELQLKCRALHGLVQILNKECLNLDVAIEVNKYLIQHLFENM
jgi:hypothetical protein